MLLKKKNIISLFILSLILSIALISCSKSDTTVDPVDDGGGPVDDSPPLGFQGEIDWIKTFGGSGEDEALAIVKSIDNGYVIVGNTRSNDGDIVDKTTTDEDFWVLKISETGAILWNRTFGGTNNDSATDISNTADGGYIISGGTRSDDGDITTGNAGFIDYWILKLDANGEKQWGKTFGFLGEDVANQVFQTKDGGYFVTGYFDFNGANGGGNDGRSQHAGGEYWAIKMAPSGEYIWRRFFGGFNDDESYAAIETSDGGFLLLGASESPDGDITDNNGGYDYWVVKIDANGTKLWTRSYGGSEIETGYAATTTNDGNFLLVGDTRSDDGDVTLNHGNADLWVIKFSQGGNLIWNSSFGGAAFETAHSISPINNGNYVICGSTRSNTGDVSFNNGENDAWVVIMDPDGNLLFEKTIGGSTFDFGDDAILGHDGSSIFMVGSTESNDGDIPNFQGIKDLMVVKLK